MIEKRGKSTLRIQINDVLTYVSLFIAFYFATNGELRYTDSTILYYLPGVLCFVALGVELMTKQIQISSYLIWRILLMLLLAVTLVFGLSFTSAFGIAKQVVLQSVTVLLIAVKCSADPRNLKKIMMIAVAACTVTVVYLLSTVDMSRVASGERLGVTSVNDKWNANSIGMTGVFGILTTFASVFIYTNRTTRKELVIFGILMALFGYVVVLAGSRKSILCILITAALFIMQAQKSKRIRNTMIAAIVLLVAIYAIYNVPFLYEHLGSRFDSFFATMQGEDTEKSARIRQEMIELGMKAFWDNPLLGYGMGGFSILWEEENRVFAYSHNNYVEMLVTGGILLFALYYGYIVKLLRKKCIHNKQTVFMKGILIAILIADVGMVSYYDPFVQYLLCITAYSLLYDRNLDALYSGSQMLKKLA